MAAGLGEGDEVIVPSLSFVATANAVRYTGATPVFADIAGLDRPWLSAAAAADAIGERTKAIMGMSYGGHPGETDELAALASERGLLMLEDAAHGLGGRSGSGPLGTVGAMGAYSFFSNKNLPVGEGGALVCDDDGVRRAGEAAALARDDQPQLGSPQGPLVRLRRGRAGLQLPDRRAAGRAGGRTARRGSTTTTRRGRSSTTPTARRWPAIDRVEPAMPPPARGSSAHHIFTVVVDEGVDRDAVRESLAGGARPDEPPLPADPPVLDLRAAAGELPLTDAYASRAITLPLFPHMEAGALETVIDALADALG